MDNAFDKLTKPQADAQDQAQRAHLPAPGSPHQPNEHEDAEQGLLFEQYDRRTVREIIADQKAIRESEAANAAAIILEGIEPPTFDHAHQEYIAPKYSTDDSYTQSDFQRPDRVQSARQRHQYAAYIKSQSTTRLDWVFTPGAQIVYALLVLTVLSGLIGLAASTQSPVLILFTGIASPILLPICIWKWIRWLDSTPYYYRLMTSLGEDARNLMTSRFFFFLRFGQRSKG